MSLINVAILPQRPVNAQSMYYGGGTAGGGGGSAGGIYPRSAAAAAAAAAVNMFGEYAQTPQQQIQR